MTEIKATQGLDLSYKPEYSKAGKEKPLPAEKYPDLKEKYQDSFKFKEPLKNNSFQVNAFEDRFEFIHPEQEKALFSLRVSPNYDHQLKNNNLPPWAGRQEQHNDLKVKLDSPYFKQQFRDLARSQISDPLKDAWKSKSFDGDAMRAASFTTAALAAVYYSPVEIKSKLKVPLDMNVGNLKVQPGITVRSGKGEADVTGTNVSFSAKENSKWNMNLGYEPKKDTTSLQLNYNSRFYNGSVPGTERLSGRVEKQESGELKGSLFYNISF